LGGVQIARHSRQIEETSRNKVGVTEVVPLLDYSISINAIRLHRKESQWLNLNLFTFNNY